MSCLLPLVLTVLPTATDSAEFERRTIEGFTVFLSKVEDRGNAAETKRALDHLANQLFQISLVVPEPSLKRLRDVPIWLANGEKKLGIAFHPRRKWLTDRNYRPPESPSLIGIVSAKHYLHESLRQPWLAFHELAHGYDWFALGKRKTYGSDAGAYRRAMKSGKYKSALHWNGRHRKPYHATNKMEFFAETSEAFFGTNDIFPFVRAELRDHDPETFRVLAGLWQVDLKRQQQDERELASVLKQSFRTGQRRTSVASIDPVTPTRHYVKRMIEGWTVLVHPMLAAQKLRGPGALRQLRRDLHYIKRYVPPAAVKSLQTTRIWMEHRSGTVRYVAFHDSAKWLRTQGLNLDKAGGIEIGNAANYRRWFPQQPSVLLHLLAYGFYDRLSDTTKKEIADAFESTRGNKCYQSVLRFDGRRVPHPGLRDAREFFAELSECRFGTNDHYPFVRIELKDRDPKTYALLTRLWSGESKTSKRKKDARKVRVAGVVVKWVRGKKQTNYRRVEPLIRKAAKNGAKIVCTTECFLDGYAIADKSIPLKTYRALGEKIPGGNYVRRLSALAKELRIHLIAGMLEADGEARYNTAVVLGPDGKLIGKYRKQKLGHELVRNKPGNKSKVFSTPYGKIGVMICADRRYPDVVSRFCANGADLLICPSGGMFGPKRNDPVVQARSKENRRYIVFVHPAEFLVTAPSGRIASRTILGDRLLVKPENIGKGPDKNRVFYFDVPLHSAAIR